MNPKTSFVCLNGWAKFQGKILALSPRMTFLKAWKCKKAGEI